MVVVLVVGMVVGVRVCLVAVIVRVIVDVLVIVIVGVNGAIIMAVEAAHRSSPFVAPTRSETSIAVRVNSSPLSRWVRAEPPE